MREHPGMRLRQQRHVDGVAASRGMMEAHLVGEDRLAGARRALHDVDARDQQTAFENAIEPGNAGRPALSRRCSSATYVSPCCAVRDFALGCAAAA